MQFEYIYMGKLPCSCGKVVPQWIIYCVELGEAVGRVVYCQNVNQFTTPEGNAFPPKFYNQLRLRWNMHCASMLETVASERLARH